MNRLRVALGCLTILPLGPRGRVLDQDLGGSFLWFPVVGLGLGWCLVLVHQAASGWMTSWAAAVTVVIALILLTGALHLDGVADVCDALAGGRTVEDRLRIMKDPHVGAMAVVGIVSVLLAKIALVASLRSSAVIPGLVMALVVSRTAMVWLATASPSARAGAGTAGPFVTSGTWETLAGATLVTALVALAALGSVGLLVLGAAGMTVLLLRAFARRWFGGVTGDLLGAAGELTELVTLAAVMITGSRG